MASTEDLNLTIQQGRTYACLVRWGQKDSLIYKPITAIAQTAPARLTVPGHGLTDGWSVAVTNVKGMTEINATANKVTGRDYRPATVLDADTIEINAINAAGFRAYASGGYVQYQAPIDLTGYKARMTIRNRQGGTELLTLTTENGRISVDPVARTITLNISAADTALLAWTRGVYDLEMVSNDPTPKVTLIMSGSVAVTKEITT